MGRLHGCNVKDIVLPFQFQRIALSHTMQNGWCLSIAMVGVLVSSQSVGGAAFTHLDPANHGGGDNCGAPWSCSNLCCCIWWASGRPESLLHLAGFFVIRIGVVWTSLHN